MPEGVKVERIVHSNDGDDNKYRLSFVFNSKQYSYRIYNYDSYQMDAWSYISRITANDNSITVYANGVAPTTAIPIQILCVR